MQSFQKEDGFTLVELIVTLVIAAILAMAAMNRFLDLSNTAQAGACRCNQLALRTAQTMFYTETYIAGNARYADNMTLLTPYLKNNEQPECPGGGAYLFMALGEIRCTISRHQMD